jgi:hypothetical protein
MPELLKAKIMAWMTMWHCVAGVVLPGRSTPTNARGKTSSASPAVCTEPWLSSMDQRSAYLGRASLTKQPLLSPYLTASQSYLASGLVATATAPTPIMSLATIRVKQQEIRK